MNIEFKAGDRYGRLRRPVLILTGKRDEVLDLEACVASALSGGERGTGGDFVDYEGIYIAIRVADD